MSFFSDGCGSLLEGEKKFLTRRKKCSCLSLGGIKRFSQPPDCLCYTKNTTYSVTFTHGVSKKSTHQVAHKLETHLFPSPKV